MSVSLSTEVKISRSFFDLTYQTPIITIGSCFSDHIGEILLKHKFNILKNPFGVLYNPYSIAQVLRLAIQKQEITSDDLIFHNHLWHSFYFHSSFSDTNRDQVLVNTNGAIRKVHESLKTANILFVTFGTAWVYQYDETNIIVSNCHKLPTNKFNRFRLTIDEITKEWESLILELKRYNPNVKIIFTVSPIRHLKDGAHENQLSKSVLHISIDKLISNHENFNYFPSYEIVNDELRDYRFYADDMVHISEKAIQYLFEKFESAYFSNSTIECINDINTIIRATEHRILNNNMVETRKFAQAMIKKINVLEIKYPFVNLLLEKNYFQNL